MSVSPWDFRIPHISFFMLVTQKIEKYFSRKIFFRKIFFMPFQVPMKLRRIEKSHAFAGPFKEKGKAFNLTCSLSTSCGFMSTQTMWNFFRWVQGSSSISPLNIYYKCINLDLSSKLPLLSMFMHNGWFSMLGASRSSLSVCCCATTMMLMRAFFRNLCNIFYFEIYLHLFLVSRSSCRYE